MTAAGWEVIPMTSHDLNDDNKVNLRSYGAGDKPILLWMWAPH